MSLADEARSLTALAEKEQHQKNELIANLEREREGHQFNDGIKKAVEELPSLLIDIRNAAIAGKRTYRIPIYQWQFGGQELTDRQPPSLSPFLKGYALTLEGTLAREGFAVSTNYSEMEPCGSDSLFYHTVYSYSLLVSWA